MSKPTRKSNTERRRALKLLASNADGCTEAIMLAHGFTVLADGAVVGRIMRAAAAPEGTPWLWTLAFT